jgi:DNA-binding NarL/FixJ family response regulator
MPKKAGIEVVIELMSQKPGPGIIVLTHSAKEEDLRRAFAAGAHPYYLRRLAITPLPGRIINIWKGID